MPVSMNGFLIKKSPRDQNVTSYPVTKNNLAAVTTRTSFPTEFNGIARSVAFINLDVVNVATLRINGITTQAITLNVNSQFNFNDQWVTDIEVIAGALGAVLLIAEVVPLSEVI